MQTVLFLDLDDSIFQTRPKCPEGEPLVPAAYRKDGTALSFMTVKQRAWLDLWLGSAVVIPTTARNHDAFRRVDLPFTDLAILDFGGVILQPGGMVDPAWDARVRPLAQQTASELRSLLEVAEGFIRQRQLGVYARLIVDFDMPLYVVVKDLQGDAAKLEAIRAYLETALDREQFFLHANDNNLSIVPRFLGKERAVRYILDTRFQGEAVLTVGMGDSFTDAGFMGLCDYSVLPRGCQLARSRFAPRRD